MARTKKDVSSGPVCTWTEDHEGNWDTACDEKHILIEGTPKENHMRFCCYCGRPIAQVTYR